MLHQYKKILKNHYYNQNKWNESIANNIAKKELINMTSQHWEIIYIVKIFYCQFKITPSMRMLLTFSQKKMGHKTINSRYLFKLFSENSLIKISKIAGIPKPNSCL
ncbi:TusE/DsrC/DsvC family sulfur relay protein [Buchnera aphidicola (Formosaphis micheliae)]|uniref:TusE/DsrC/DsvC family sulfur relay protein n=1 Tax=Buchnera aphidicola TaxID=9 RepID=UPI0031B81BCA